MFIVIVDQETTDISEVPQINVKEVALEQHDVDAINDGVTISTNEGLGNMFFEIQTN
jgi:uncharacterized protein YllA (UPF0747 family)